ncbi:hypothetical protein [Pedobacter cryophilus]|uniref:hypothetical protein n=1 Tax=Pedobacter cryophilus TaxID=2571271 RepID=UPI00145E6652|nr:hypothetical protein [Pedobacter cryophilus]
MSQNIFQKLIQEGELPQVNVEIGLTRETLTDIAITALIVSILITLLNKFLLSKL